MYQTPNSVRPNLQYHVHYVPEGTGARVIQGAGTSGTRVIQGVGTLYHSSSTRRLLSLSATWLRRLVVQSAQGADCKSITFSSFKLFYFFSLLFLLVVVVYMLKGNPI